jgi:hypothetical protein
MVARRKQRKIRRFVMSKGVKAFNLSEESLSYLEWLKDEKFYNLSAFMDDVVRGLAADDDRYQPGSEWVEGGCQTVDAMSYED